MSQKSDSRSWNGVTFPNARTTAEIRTLRGWLRANLSGEFRVRTIRETVQSPSGKTRLVTVCAFVRIENDADTVLTKMHFGTSVL